MSIDILSQEYTIVIHYENRYSFSGEARQNYIILGGDFIMYQVRKRNGDIVLFEMSKLKTSVIKAFEQCNRNYQDSILETLCIKIVANAETKIKDSILDVKDIQTSAENILLGYGYEDVSNAYASYRRLNDKKTTLLDYKKLVESYVKRDDWRVKENSSVTYSLGGLILGNSGAVVANYWLSEIYDDEIANAHKNCDFHIHDLSMLSAYCFTGDTKVAVVSDDLHTISYIPFEDIVSQNMNEFYVLSHIDEDRICAIKANNPRITRYVNDIIEITVRTVLGDVKIKSTEDHLYMLEDYSYAKANELEVGQYLVGVSPESCGNSESISDYFSEYYPEIIGIKHIKLDSDIPVYDLTVPKYHNFAVDGNVFVHNCGGWSLKKLISEGFGGIAGKTSSKPAAHLSTICNQMINYLGCFTDDTRIILADGSTPTIRELLDSDKEEWLVKSYDEKENKVVAAVFDNLHKTRTVQEYISLEFSDNDVITCTLDHKFYTENRGWVEANNLNDRDRVVSINVIDGKTKLTTTYLEKSWYIRETRDVYCGTVHNDFHGFFVNDGKLVHNCLQNEWAG